MEAMKIMLVDDEERLLQTTKKLFNKMGIEVITTTNGEEAVDLINKENIHVVFMDIKMPGIDGMETLRKIKKENPLVEVIILTGHATMESAVEGLKLGAMDYLIKPLSMKNFLEKAEDAFEKVKRQKQKILKACRTELPVAGRDTENTERR
ncbi:response regulator [Pseudodesulfovibrio tunisiensis]|uniref:response regulator n=1 Tax=Pseudodesulfovibrio tunisiensis TaxID=463192 RepID=UPI001FB1DDB3|nr:response regulator [Pseudodesulfovibrio tunisiensis]